VGEAIGSAGSQTSLDARRRREGGGPDALTNRRRLVWQTTAHGVILPEFPY
jgi:hypothetical protein